MLPHWIYIKVGLSVKIEQMVTRDGKKMKVNGNLFSWTFDLLDNNFWNLKVIVHGQKRPKSDQKSSKVRQKSPKDQKSLSVDAHFEKSFTIFFPIRRQSAGNRPLCLPFDNF